MAQQPRGRGFWAPVVQELVASGLPTSVFATKRGLNVHTLRYWSWRLRSEAMPPRVVELVPVEPAAAPPDEPGPGVEVHVGDVRMVLPLSMSPGAIAALVRELARC